MVYVRETNAGRSIRAIVIMRGKRHVATVQAHYGASRVTVSVWHNDGTPVQQARASGYGYDKFTAALSGLTIDGHRLTDHCGESRKPPRGAKVWPSDAKPPRGWRFANYSTDLGGYTDCYRLPGLAYLEAIGYSVINAI